MQSDRRQERASVSAQSWTTEQLGGFYRLDLSTFSLSLDLGKSGKPLFGGVWSEGEIRSVEGSLARHRMSRSGNLSALLDTAVHHQDCKKRTGSRSENDERRADPVSLANLNLVHF